jgi:general secretion pathway protein F
MPAFEYQALNSKGQKKQGIIEGDTAKRARQQLRDQGLAPIKVEPIHENGNSKTKRKSTRHGKANTKDLALITRQLAALSRSGLPLEESLRIVSAQTEKKRIQKIILSLRSSVLEGQSLSQACSQYPNAFPPLYRATLEAGESSGKLDAILERLADHLENREQIMQKVQLAMIYPILLTTISVLVVIGLLTFVIPEIVGVFENLGQKLPALTQGLITLSEILKQYGIYILLGVSLILVIIKLLLRIDNIRFNFHKFILKTPIFGRFARGSNTASFTRTLAILTGSGVELLEALRIASQVIPNMAIKAAVKDAAINVREGGSLSQSLARSKLFPPITVHLIASGESSGQLAEMLESAASNQERDVQSYTEMAVGIFEPVLILVMGGVVLTIVLAILMPIFDMNQLIR